ncbi:MAG: hypothetical protein EX272_09645 [Chromatiales bacterium]|nr:MAG: hypothetical protein EX272_09645 [Chromatiales bacterium]
MTEISAKAACSKAARTKLVESRAKLNSVRAAIRQATSTGRLRPSEQLNRALGAMEVNFAAAETQLRVLQKSGEDDWENARVELDGAWENLARSIALLVARLSDESHD